jgi:hypothetical protein
LWGGNNDPADGETNNRHGKRRQSLQTHLDGDLVAAPQHCRQQRK